MPLHSSKGFTLIELVIVITILALLSMVVIPKHVNMQKDAEYHLALRVGAGLKAACATYRYRSQVQGGALVDIAFDDFVSFSQPGNAEHTFEIESSLTNTLKETKRTVASSADGWTTITLEFKSGAKSVYTIVPSTAVITDTHVGFTEGGGGGCSS